MDKNPNLPCLICSHPSGSAIAYESRTSEGVPLQSLDLPCCSLRCAADYLLHLAPNAKRSLLLGFAAGHDLAADCDRCGAPAKMMTRLDLRRPGGRACKTIELFSCGPDCHETLIRRLAMDPADAVLDKADAVTKDIKFLMRPRYAILQDKLAQEILRKARRGGELR